MNGGARNESETNYSMSPKEQVFQFNYQLLHHVKLVKIFQQYRHLKFAGVTSKLGDLDGEIAEVMTLF